MSRKSYKPKYKMYQLVWTIYTLPHYDREPCKTCNETGTITIQESGIKMRCQYCRGVGYNEVRGWDTWQIFRNSTIGKIDTELTAPEFVQEGKKSFNVKYMLVDSGIGSGSCYNEENVFPSEEEALKECEIRNKMISKK